MALLGGALLMTACQAPTSEMPEFGVLQPFQEDPLVGSLIQQRLQASKEAPSSFDAWLALGIAFEAHDFLPEAERCYVYALGLETSPQQAGQGWYRLATARASQGDFDAAVDAYRQSIEAVPDYPPSNWRRGLIEQRRGNQDAAEADFRRALELDPNQYPAAWGLAKVKLNRGQAEAAVTLLEPVVERLQRRGPTTYLLGLAYRDVGRLDEARELLRQGTGEQAIDLDPATAASFGLTSADPWQQSMHSARISHRAVLQRARQAFEAGQLDQAIAMLENLRPHRRDDVTLALNLATVYRQAQRPAEALALLQGLHARHPVRYDLTMDLALTLWQNGEPSAAMAMLDKAAELAPGDPGPDQLRRRIERGGR